MNRLQTYYENLNIPLKLAGVGAVLVAIGSILGNPYIHEVLRLDSSSVTQLTRTLLVCGALILSYFPITVFIKLLQMRTDDKEIVIVGLVSYAIFLVMILLFAPHDLAANAYVPWINVTVETTKISMMRTGVLGLVGVYFIVKWVYKRQFGIKYFNVLSIMNANMLRLIYAILLSALFGYVYAMYWPGVINWLYSLLRFIAADVFNPMVSFAFAGLDRITSLLGINSIVRNEMWLGSLGGTWNGLDNITYVGDINIWNAQLLSNLSVLGFNGAGRYSTGFYILNVFAIPGYILALFTTVTDKKRRNKALAFAVFAILISMLAGVLIQVEFFMLLTAPALYLFHLFMTGLISAILSGFSVTMGFSFLGITEAANPGNIIDLIGLFRQKAIGDQIIILLLFGAIVFFAYFFITRFYYSRMAMDVLNVGSKDDDTTDFIERVGGLENIVTVSSTPTRIVVALKDSDDINVEGLHHQGVTRIVKSRQGYILSYGSGAYMLQKEINRRLKALKKSLIQEEENV